MTLINREVRQSVVHQVQRVTAVNDCSPEKAMWLVMTRRHGNRFLEPSPGFLKIYLLICLLGIYIYIYTQNKRNLLILTYLCKSLYKLNWTELRIWKLYWSPRKSLRIRFVPSHQTVAYSSLLFYFFFSNTCSSAAPHPLPPPFCISEVCCALP